jgi:hypothetical protein
LYVLSSTTGEIHIFDVETPANPVEVGVYDTEGAGYDFSVSGQYVYVAKGYDGLSIVDVSDPAQLQEIATYQDPLIEFGNILVQENYAYVYAYSEGLLIFDLSDPQNVVQIGSLAIFAIGLMHKEIMLTA